jgi:hypothetical protein
MICPVSNVKPAVPIGVAGFAFEKFRLSLPFKQQPG